MASAGSSTVRASERIRVTTAPLPVFLTMTARTVCLPSSMDTRLLLEKVGNMRFIVSKIIFSFRKIAFAFGIAIAQILLSFE